MRPIRIERSQPYQRLKRELRADETRRELDLVEESIIVDPIHRFRRAERDAGTVVDFSAKRIFVMFELREDSIVFLDLFEPGSDET